MILDLGNQPVEKLDRGRVDPVRIFQDDEHGMAPRQRDRIGQDALDRCLFALLGGRRRMAQARRGDPEKFAQRLGRAVGVVERAFEDLRQRGDFFLIRILFGKMRRLLQVAEEWKERRLPVQRRAEKTHADAGILFEFLAHPVENARLADTGLARQQHHAALALADLVPSPAQERDFLLAADEGCRLAAQRLEAAFDDRDALHLVGFHRSGEAFHLDTDRSGEIEQVADQAPSGLRDQNPVCRRHDLEARRQIGCLADGEAFAPKRGLERLADDDEAGRDADADVEAEFGVRERRQLANDF